MGGNTIQLHCHSPSFEKSFAVLVTMIQEYIAKLQKVQRGEMKI